ncbi:MurR/RpiR family transcriptional regulator [Pleomorphomonas koreensis]|uniref:MurR/RpiR family transcriptional regulator n=1 Tax=Pleomorphomonas koreensis TaxID=257440 RepID=UPI00047CAAD4|nr:MurR/RpiR family transcriptional regulator [Pleomorphomonas koreensis]
MTDVVTGADDSASLMTRLSQADLSSAEKRLIETLFSLADYELATLTSAALAERAGASRATVDRLARRFGYAGQKEMRHALLRESRAMRAGVDEVMTPSPQIALGDGPLEIAYKVFNNASVRALKFAELLAQTDVLPRLVAAMHDARSIQLFGAGASAVVALDMHQRLVRLGLRIGMAQDAHTQIAQAALMGDGDLAVAISFSGMTRTTVEAAATARARGARVAAILARSQSPLGDIADLKVLTPPGVGLFGTDASMTRILQMMLNEVLFHCLAVKDVGLLENVRRIDAVLNSEKIGAGDFRRRPAGSDDRDRSEGHRET